MVSFAPNPAYDTAASLKYDTPLAREGGTLYLISLGRPSPRPARSAP